MELRDKNGLTEKEFLAAYKEKDYKKPSLTADIAVFSGTSAKREILLIRRGGHPCLGHWALPGGFANDDESIEQTAARELAEETHLQNLPMEEIGLFSQPHRDPRTWVVSDAFAALIPEEQKQLAHADDDAADSAWFIISLNETEKDHFKIRFSSEKDDFEVELLKKMKPGVTSPQAFFEIVKNGGLAFDHALIIARALNRMKLI